MDAMDLGGLNWWAIIVAHEPDATTQGSSPSPNARSVRRATRRASAA